MQWIINIATNYLRFLASMVAVFVMTPYIIDKLGVDQFGLWTLIYAVVSLFGLMDFGLATAAVKFVAEATGAGDLEDRNRTLATLLIVYAAIGITCAALILALAGPLRGFFDLTAQQQTQFVPVLCVLGIAIALNFPASLFKASMSGAGRMDVVNAFDLIMVAVNVTLTYTLLEAGYGIVGLAVSTAATLVGTSLAMIPLSYWLIPGFSVSWRKVSRQRIRPLLAFSGYAFLANVALLITLRIDPIAIKLFLPMSAIAVYAIAAKISEYVFLLNKQFSNALMPLVSQLHGRGEANAIRLVMIDGTRFLLAFALPGITLLFYYAPEFIHLWLGDEFAESATLLRILLVAMVPVTLQLNAANVLGMTGHHRFLALCMLGSAALNLCVSIGGVAAMGLTGAALGTLFAVLAVEAGLILPRACDHTGIGVGAFLASAVAPALPALLPMFALCALLERAPPAPNMGVLLLKIGICGVVYLLAFAATALKPAERSLLRQRLQRTPR